MQCKRLDITSTTSSRANPFSSTRRNSLESPLLRLPAELRNKIYASIVTLGHVYIDKNYDKTSDKPDPFSAVVHNDSDINRKLVHAFMRDMCSTLYTCRQVRAECISLLCSLNTIHVQLEILKGFVNSLPRCVRSGIRVLHITITSQFFDERELTRLSRLLFLKGVVIEVTGKVKLSKGGYTFGTKRAWLEAILMQTGKIVDVEVVNGYQSYWRLMSGEMND
jgi:hypothetical protein